MSTRKIGLYSGPIIGFLFVFFIQIDPGNPLISRTAGVALWMAIWWISEAVPLAVTSLLPVVLFPAFGIMSGKQVSPIYFNHIIFLFIGGFLVALAVQRWNLHKRIALQILLWVGVNPKNILLGFMIATAFLSMWISNTATTMMMVPIALSIIQNLEDNLGPEPVRKYSLGIFLGVAYSASIGGIATLVGTPPNLSFVRILHILFPAAPEISFATWFLFAFPISTVFLIIVWILLASWFRPPENSFKLDSNTFDLQFRKLGPMSYEEKIVFADFVLMAILWLTRADISIGSITIHGWANLFPHPEYMNDGTVAICMAILLFITPTRNKTGSRLLTWETAAKLPWNIVLLFGGGFALATGFKVSGLAEWLGNQLTVVGSLDPIFIIVVLCLFATFLTELTSNTATTEMLLPILGSLAIAIQLNPLFLMIPATLSCSFAFMLPVATPPNAIVFGTNRIEIKEMVRVGIWLNLIGMILVTLMVILLGRFILGIDLTQFPDWALTQ